jgi:hypothetical protein
MSFTIEMAGAQIGPAMYELSGTQDGTIVRLFLTLNQGSTCNGIIIERSTDSIHYTEIGTVSGICGNISKPTNYDFADSMPSPNAVNLYKVRLGSFVTLPIRVFFARYNIAGYALSSNPSHVKSTLYFANDTRQKFVFRIFDQSGRQIYVADDIRDNSYDFDTGHLPAGCYIFRLTAEDQHSIEGRFTRD